MDSENILKIIFGTIILLLGFFNKSGAKQRNKPSKSKPSRRNVKPIFEMPDMGSLLDPIKTLRKDGQTNKKYSTSIEGYKRPEFVSSLELVSNFGQENSSPIFSSSDVFYDDDIAPNEGFNHPILQQLQSEEERMDELRKAIVYGEILRRRY